MTATAEPLRDEATALTVNGDGSVSDATGLVVGHVAGGTAVAMRQSTAVAPRPVMRLLRPVAEPAEIISAQDATRQLVAQALKKGRDYGEIPGTDKPTLLKPGAERVALAFGCYYGKPRIIEKEIDHDREVRYVKRKKQWRNQFHGDREFTWIEETGLSYGLYRYVLEVPVIDRATGAVVGSGIASCSTMESKYIDRPRDSENTALKMAHKRAIVGAALVTFGLSDQFTQDVEDLPQFGGGAPAAEPEPPITRDSLITWGKQKDTPIRDLTDDYLAWAVEPGRKFGSDTARWQEAMRAEIAHREAKRDDTRDAAVEGEQRERPTQTTPSANGSSASGTGASTSSDAKTGSGTSDASCPKCGGRMWDNRTTKTKPKAPDFKCRDRSCDGVIWPGQSAANDAARAGYDGDPNEVRDDRHDDPADDLPF